MRVRAAKRDSDTLRSSQDEGACAGKSLRQMLEAELQRTLIKYLRAKEASAEEGTSEFDDLLFQEENLKGQIKAYSHSLLIVIAPYDRGNEKSRKAIVSEAMAKAKHMHNYMKERDKK